MYRKGIDYDWLSQTGRRSTNEDRALCEVKESSTVGENQIILAVADGMGGLEAGEVASRTVHDQLIKMFRDGLPGDLRQAAGRIDVCIKLCCRSIYDWSQQKKGAQVGTTVSGAVIIGNRCLVFNVGDSRTYVIQAGGIKPLTKDHSADREAYEAGIIKKEEIGKGTYSNALTRAIGTDPDVKVDILTYELKKGDIIFSCTDGLWGKVTDEDIWRLILGKSSMQKSLEALYKLAYKNESKDNISMAAYRYGGHAGQQGTVIKKGIKKMPASVPLEEKVLENKEFIRKKKQNKLLFPLLFIAIAAWGLVTYLIIDLTREPVRQINAKPPPGPPKGGVIESEVIGSIKKPPVRVKLSATPVTFPNGDPIAADIHYTLNGTEPTKEKGIKYTGSEPIEIKSSGKHILIARVFAGEVKYEGPRYSREFDILKICHTGDGEKSSAANETLNKRGKHSEAVVKPVDTKKETTDIGEKEGKVNTTQTIETIPIIDNFNELESEMQNEIRTKTKKIEIIDDDINKIKNIEIELSSLLMQLVIDPKGNSLLSIISGRNVIIKGDCSKDCLDMINTILKKFSNKNLKFKPPKVNGKPIEVRIFIYFKKPTLYQRKLILSKEDL